MGPVGHQRRATSCPLGTSGRHDAEVTSDAGRGGLSASQRSIDSLVLPPEPEQSRPGSAGEGAGRRHAAARFTSAATRRSVMKVMGLASATTLPAVFKPPCDPRPRGPLAKARRDSSGTGLPRAARRGPAHRTCAEQGVQEFGSRQGSETPGLARDRGAKGIRTPGLFHAMEALYQLSYSPESG